MIPDPNPSKSTHIYCYIDPTMGRIESLFPHLSGHLFGARIHHGNLWQEGSAILLDMIVSCWQKCSSLLLYVNYPNIHVFKSQNLLKMNLQHRRFHWTTQASVSIFCNLFRHFFHINPIPSKPHPLQGISHTSIACPMTLVPLI